MTVQTKFDIGQKVWFMFDNKPVHAVISGIRIMVAQGKAPVVDYEVGMPFELPEGQLFVSKEALVKSL